MSKLRISRDSGYADRARKYTVMCEGKELGKIGNGESVEFDVPPGEKEVYLKVDWCRSNKVRINVPTEGTAQLSGGSNLRGPRIMLAIVYVLFKPHDYLWLTAQAD